MKDRRELLKGLAVGTAWSAPVVQSIMIPAHGATTCGELTQFDRQIHSQEAEDCSAPSCPEWAECMAERYCLDSSGVCIGAD